ncbi:MAG TPA: hypothetical protein VMH01_11625 [Puia sp.]|nr:hypothetical protein [Puia sp.]
MIKNAGEYYRKSYYLFLIAFGLISIIAFTLMLMAISFLVGGTLTPWHFPLAVLSALLINFFACRFFFQGKSKPVFIKTTVSFLAITFISILVARFFYDVSGDGQLYHLEAVYQLGTKWNPIRTQLPSFSQSIWVNHYGKGDEGAQAAIYVMTGKIESGKATNFMLFTASFLLCLSFLYRLNRFSFRKKLFLSALFACNPVTMLQLISTCVDGQMASLLLSLLVVYCLLFIDTNRFFLLLLAFILVILVNIKFTGIVFASVFSFGYIAILLVNKRKIEARKIFITCALSAIIGIGLVGYFPYITNTISYNDPIYPGTDVLQKELAKQCPTYFQSRNRFGKFFISFFSHTDDLDLLVDKNPHVSLKLPFTFNKTDIVNALKPGVVVMAGMGPFFSGAFMLSLLFFVILARRLSDRRIFWILSLTLVTIVISIFLISEAWWARLAPQVWLIPLIIALSTEWVNINWVNRMRTFFYIIVAINISFTFVVFPYYFYKAFEINYQLAQLKASKQTISVELTYHRCNRVRFYENNIPFKEEHLEGDSVVYMVNSGTKFIMPKNIPDVPKPFILKWGMRFNKK